MAERAPSLPCNNHNDHRPLSLPKQPQPAPPPMSQQLVLSQPQNPSLATFRSGTYVVQVPKDQIYRVPPPENAFIVKQHGDPSHNKKKPLCCSLCCLSIIAFIVVFLIVLVTSILVTFSKADGPNFNVERLVVSKADEEDRPDFTVTVKARNPNSRIGIVYKLARGGVTLKFKQTTIATGKYPSMYQGGGKSKEVALTLHASNTALPKEIEKSMGISSSSINKKEKKNNNHVRLSLEMKILAQLRIGTMNSRSTKFHVTCFVMVDKLLRGNKILRQECHTDRK